MFVDNAAMRIIQWPKSFDVICNREPFGDILTDEASVITGSLGMLPSASWVFTPRFSNLSTAPILRLPVKNYCQSVGNDSFSMALMFEYAFGMMEEGL